MSVLSTDNRDMTEIERELRARIEAQAHRLKLQAGVIRELEAINEHLLLRLAVANEQINTMPGI